MLYYIILYYTIPYYEEDADGRVHPAGRALPPGGPEVPGRLGRGPPQGSEPPKCTPICVYIYIYIYIYIYEYTKRVVSGWVVSLDPSFALRV